MVMQDGGVFISPIFSMPSLEWQGQSRKAQNQANSIYLHKLLKIKNLRKSFSNLHMHSFFIDLICNRGKQFLSYLITSLL